MTQDADRQNPKHTDADAAPMSINRMDENFLIEAALVGELLDIPATNVPALMRSGDITSVCESGVDADEGTFRLNLFYRNRHARLRVDPAGRILQRSIIDFGGKPRHSASAPATQNTPEKVA